MRVGLKSQDQLSALSCVACRWLGRELTKEEEGYGLLMLGALLPRGLAVATCPEVLNGLEACAEAKQWAAKWLAGGWCSVAAGVMELALEWLLTLEHPGCSSKEMGVVELVRVSS